MKKSLVIVSPILFGFLVMIATEQLQPREESEKIISTRIDNSIGCGPLNEGSFDPVPDSKVIALLPGWGNHAYEISTKSDSAQIFFNQGLSMYYSYHSRESIASFREAARFDSSAAMTYWAQALAMGPSYNFGYMYKLNPSLEKVIPLMNYHSKNLTGRERDLIAAMNTRYDITDASDSRRPQMNQQYADAMKLLVAKYPDDIDIKALYVDAVMLIHPWSFWNNDGTAKPWTPELVQYCKEILEKDPIHPAAHHYYIHVTEASRKPEVALASADSLWKLFPGVAHMVHMSSHEYERIGYYAKGVRANEEADKSLVLYDSLTNGVYGFAHVPHYYAVEAYCALSGAMYKEGVKKAITCRNSMEPTADGWRAQYQYMFPSLAYIRMGKWQDVLNDKTEIKKEWVFAGIIDDFAKGMAYTKTGNIAKAEDFLRALKVKMQDKHLRTPMAPFASSPYEVSEVVNYILAANIQFKQGKFDNAIRDITKAIRAEDSLLYIEPKAWLLPARQYLGAFLLQMKKAPQAELVYREDLMWNPGNGWSLLGLHQALLAQGKKEEQADLKKRYLESFSEAEDIPTTSAY